MESSDWISLGAIIVSTIALGVSIIAIWNTHFKKFTPILTVGNCKFRIYPIKSEGEKWYLPSFNIPISFTNNGAQIGKIEDIRIKISFPELPIPNHYEIFEPKWIVDGKKLTNNRFEWIDNAVLEDWMPTVIVSKETKIKEIVFETRWEEPVIQKKMLCILEIKIDDKPKWIKAAEWNYFLDEKRWLNLAERGTAYISSPKPTQTKDVSIQPADLHKYTGTKEPLPKLDLNHAPSYLDYKKDEKASG
ncbi:hypothetical protein [Arenibacter algicola]|uniref:hypothetical protein n=1 Tax=Arenibacter algicola TaxID=616991 RepID=UPI0004DF6C74|nr:hypothetical protein [Arenibacter algicola]